MNAKNFFAELKPRNVYKVAIAYAVVAWLLMQIASQVFPFFGIPNWAVPLVVLLLVIGFPVALIPTSDMAAYDLYLRAKGLIYDSDVIPSRGREDLLIRALAHRHYFSMTPQFDHEKSRTRNFVHGSESKVVIARHSAGEPSAAVLG